MLSRMKWVRTGLAALMVVALLSAGLVWAKPPKGDDPPPAMYQLELIYGSDVTPAVGGLNNSGAMVGLYASTVGIAAFVYTPADGLVDLNTLLPAGSGLYLTYAWDINDTGQIAGAGDINGESHAYRCTLEYAVDGTIVGADVLDLGKLNPDDIYSSGRFINEAGQVLGISRDANNQHFAFLYTDGLGMQPILPGVQTEMLSMSGNGAILGYVTGTLPMQVFRIMPGQAPEYFTSDGEGFGPRGINDSGEFIAKAEILVQVRKRTVLHTRAVRHDGVTALDLGAGDYSDATDINNAGDVVGGFGGSFWGNPFVYLESEQSIFPLSDAVTGSADDLTIWQNASIYQRSINDMGQISGYLNPGDGNFIGFILTPIAN